MKTQALSGKLLCFEPQKGLHQLLQNNLALNDLTNVETYQMGVSDRSETLHVETTDYKTHWNYGSFSLNKGYSTEFVFDGNIEQVPLQVVALDEFMPVQNLSHLDLLKIDAEGFDVQVLKGAKNTLAKFKPLIFVECGENNASELIDVLNALDYQPYWVISARYQEKNFRQAPPYNANIYAADANLLCVPKTLLEEISHPHTVLSELHHQYLALLLQHLIPAHSFEQVRKNEINPLVVM